MPHLAMDMNIIILYVPTIYIAINRERGRLWLNYIIEQQELVIIIWVFGKMEMYNHIFVTMVIGPSIIGMVINAQMVVKVNSVYDGSVMLKWMNIKCLIKGYREIVIFS